MDRQRRIEQTLRDTTSFAALIAASPPKELFHYTSAAGLRRIVETKALSATNLRHVNDAMELAWGTRLAREEIERARKKEIGANAEELLGNLMEAVNVFQSKARTQEEIDPSEVDYAVYAFCLSTVGDDLPQWRAYGHGGRGYAIEFDGQLLKDRVRTVFRMQDQEPEEVPLRPVIYDETDQRRCFREILDTAIKALGDADQRGVRNAARQVVGEAIPLMKHPSFRSENEWRVATLRIGDDPTIQWRDREGRLFPFVSFRCKCCGCREDHCGRVECTDSCCADGTCRHDQCSVECNCYKFEESSPPRPTGADQHHKSTCLPIRGITAGPTVPFELEAPALDLLLRRLADGVYLRQSAIPLK
jgi:hypothetical protein